MELVYFVILVGTLFLQEVSSEAFSATANLVHLVEGEEKMIEQFESYLEFEKERIKSMQQYINEMKTAREEIKKSHALNYAGHPINAYSLIKRWYRLTTYMSETSKKQEKLKSEYKHLPIPTLNDYKGAMAALIRLQRVFHMETDDMIQGVTRGIKGVHELYSEDFYEIGNIAFANYDYGLTIQWLEKAEQNPNTKAVASNIYKQLARAYKEIGDIKTATKKAENAYNLAPTLKGFYNNLVSESENLPADFKAKFNSTTWDRNLPDWKVNYERLCRGEPDATADPKYAKDLVCRYRPSALPYYRFKEEILSWDPRIGMFYEVITDKEAEMVIKKAYPLLYRAVVGDPAKAYATSERISKVAWLWDEDKEIKRLSERVQLITGLATEFHNPFSNAEPFQVVNYGMGGQYEPHVDYYENPEELKNIPDFIQNTGDRIATFLYYLSQITIGGSTVYPKVNIRVPPVKNAAAFWYNAKLNGELDKRTEHAGCPVLVGQKWVVNKWIRQFGQFSRRPCALSEHAIDTA